MNTQNIPRSLKDVKRLFIPKLDALLFCDYSAIEVRILAFYLSRFGDDSIAAEIRDGVDPHRKTAQLMWPGEEIDDTKRQIAKKLNFSIIYGGGRPTIVSQLSASVEDGGIGRDVSFPEAGRLLKTYHAARPGIQPLAESMQATLRERGYLKDLWGRRLHVPDPHKALNAVIQGCAADLMKDAMLRVHDELSCPWWEAHIVNVVHDDLQIDCREAEIPKLVEILPGLMSDPAIAEIVPIDVEFEVSRTNWAEKEKLHD